MALAPVKEWPGRSTGGPCSHRATVAFMDVAEATHGRKLRRYTCGRCVNSWWECDGFVVRLPEVLGIISDTAKPGPHRRRRAPASLPAPATSEAPVSVPGAGNTPVSLPGTGTAPAALSALLGLVSQAIGTDLVAFATASPQGWQVVSYGGPRAVATDAPGWQKLFTLVADLPRSGELPPSLAAVCPGVAAPGAYRLLGAPLLGPSGTVSAAIVAAYRVNVTSDGGKSMIAAPGVSAETLSCMGKLVEVAYRYGRRTGAAPGDPAVTYGAIFRPAPGAEPTGDRQNILMPRDVAEMFAVTTRTVANWATSGTLRCKRTVGGHLRFQKGDVLDLYAAMGARALRRALRNKGQH